MQYRISHAFHVETGQHMQAAAVVPTLSKQSVLVEQAAFPYQLTCCPMLRFYVTRYVIALDACIHTRGVNSLAECIATTTLVDIYKMPGMRIHCKPSHASRTNSQE